MSRWKLQQWKTPTTQARTVHNKYSTVDMNRVSCQYENEDRAMELNQSESLLHSADVIVVRGCSLTARHMY